MLLQAWWKGWLQGAIQAALLLLWLQ